QDKLLCRMCAFKVCLLAPIRRKLYFISNQVSCQLCLDFGKRPYAALWLNQSDKNQAGMLRMKHSQIEWDSDCIFPVNESWLKKRKVNFIAGGSYDHVVSGRRTICKKYSLA